MLGLKARARAPRILVIENVVGAITSNAGKDFEELCRALHALGYVFGALTMDAVHFVPQSRPRLFIVAIRKDLPVPPMLIADEPDDVWASASLRNARGALPPHLKAAWRWWRLPPPPKRNATLAELIEEAPRGVAWHSPEETERLISLMSDVNRRKLAEAAATGRRHVGTIYRRTRPDGDGNKVQRAEVRFDGVAGCLRTPEGGSSRQTVMIVKGDLTRSRLLSPREAARLMGLPDSYILPERYNDAYHLLEMELLFRWRGFGKFVAQPPFGWRSRQSDGSGIRHAIDIAYRRRAVATITNRIGCYVLCDLDQVPIYVGKSTDGIRSRVRRHLTSARSDIIANRQVDVWEIAWVWTYPVDQTSDIAELEARLFRFFHAASPLMNGSIPRASAAPSDIPKPEQIIQVMSGQEIAEKQQPALRLPRQAEHYSAIVGHFLAVKNSRQIAGAMNAHFERLRRYHAQLLATADPTQKIDRRDAPPHASIFKAAMKASCGISTLPNWRMRFLPSFCLSRSLRLRETSPP